jgi:hypothetical protein
MPFLALVHVPDGPHPDGIAEQVAKLPPGYRLVGIFDFPDRSELQCYGNCVHKGMSSWSRDARGFMKCQICGYRPKKLRRWLAGHLFDLLGANLYENTPAAFRTPQGYGS